MTPGARVAAAIEVLQDMAEGQPAEKALTRWARRSRFAGSKDRAAIRDHVFDLLRCKRSAAHFGGAGTPRALMIGLLREQGADLSTLFHGEGHAPAPLSPSETTSSAPPEDIGIRWNLPDWLLPLFQKSLGARAEKAAVALQDRAPITLRVNLQKVTRENAAKALETDGIFTKPNALCDTALTITEGARKLRASRAYLDGLVELQDAASQAVVAALPAGRRVLDFCAGGGGKTLALAAAGGREVYAHDSDAGRMADLPERATRAGVEINRISTQNIDKHGLFDIVLCDVPCSGAGAWRRAPEGKWTLTQERLTDLTAVQDDILDHAARLLAPGGTLAYATCSVLRIENEDRLRAFHERHNGWATTFERRFDIDALGDGFYTAHLIRAI